MQRHEEPVFVVARDDRQLRVLQEGLRRLQQIERQRARIDKVFWFLAGVASACMMIVVLAQIAKA